MKNNKKQILPILSLLLVLVFSILLFGKINVSANNSNTFDDFSIIERYAVGDGGLQPVVNGTDYGTGNTRWEVVGFSLIYGGTTTIMGDNQAGFFTNVTVDSRYYGTSPTIKILAGYERIYESSIYTKMAGTTAYKWHNMRFRINPANFTASNTLHGRSIFDNLLLDVSAAGKPALVAKLAPGGTGWLNAIMSAKSTSTSAHTAVKAGMLYKNGGTAYTYPVRTFVTYNGWNASASWPASSTDTVKLYFEIRLNVPVIHEMDETAPTISLSPMNNGAYVYSQNVTVTAADTGGSGLKSITYMTKVNSGAWSAVKTVASGTTFTLTGTGYHDVWGVATDGNGNTKTVHGAYYYTDQTAPTVSASALTGQQYKNGNDYWFAANKSFVFDNTGYDLHSQIANQYIRLAGSADIRAHHSWNSGISNHFNPWITHPSVHLTGVSRISNSGGYRRLYWYGTTKAYDYDFDVQYYYGDNAGNVNGYNNTGMKLRIDASAPSVPSISVSPAGWTNGNASVTIGHGADSRSGVNRSGYRINGGTWQTYAGAIPITTVGVTKIEAVTIDNVENWSGVTTSYVYIDRVAPTGTTSISTSAWTNGNVTITLATSDTGGAGYYRTLLPNGTYSTSAAPTYTVSANGTYSFTVYDHAGNSTVVSRTVSNIDKTAPTGTTSISPSSWTNGNVTITLSASDTGGSGYYRTLLPNGTYSTSTAPTYAVSANGTYSFTVFDNAGNSRVVSHTVSNIDKTAPTGTTSISPSTWTNGNVTITLSPSDTGGSGYYRTLLPNGTYSTSATPTYAVSANGTYSFTVYDHAGNSRVVTQVVSNIDKAAPSISATQNPTAWTNGAVDITVTSLDGQSGLSGITQSGQSTYAGMNLLEGSDATTEYASLAGTNREFLRTKWDLAPIVNLHGLVPYTLSFDMKVPVNGSVQAYMQNGSGARYSFSVPVNANTSWQRYSVTFTPSLANSSLVESFLAFYGTYGTGRIPTIRGVKLELGTEATAFTVHPNDAIQVGSNKVYTVTSNGTYTYRATDNAGNSSSVSMTISNIDRTVPTAGIGITPSTWTNGNVTITLSASDTGGSGYYRTLLPNGTYSTSTAPTYAVSANGTYTFTVYDHAGNSRVVTQVVANIDKVAPTGTTSISPSIWTNGNVTITLSPSDTGGSGYYRTLLPNGVYTTIATPTHVVTANGTYNFTVFDNAGNSTVVSHTVSNIDKIAPTGTTSISPSIWTNGNVTITLSPSDTGGSGYYRTLLPNGVYTTIATPTHVVTANGTYNFTVFDNAGNSTVVSRTVSNIDKIAPTGTTSISPSIWTNGNVTITLSPSDTGGSAYYRTLLPNGVYTTIATPTHVVTANGTYNFTVFDNAGNSTVVSRTVSNIDKTAPTGTTSISPSIWTNGNVTITLSPSDTGGSSYYRTLLPNGAYTTVATPTHVVTDNGTYNFTVFDNAGNSSVITRVVSNIDKIAPAGTTSITPSVWTNGNVTITLSPSDTGGSAYYRTLLPNGVYTTIATPTHVVTANGTYNFTVFDNAGNSTVVSRTVSNIDKIAPTGTTSISPSIWTNGNVTITVSASDTGGSGFYRIQKPDGTFAISTNTTYVVTVNGTYNFVLSDNVGNTRTISHTVTNIDKIVPSGVVTPSTTAWTTGNITLVLAPSDLGGSGYDRTRLPNGAYTTSTSPTYVATSNGNYTFTVFDIAGNAQSVSRTVGNIDRTAPTAPAINPDRTVWGITNITFTLVHGADSQSGISRSEYRIDGGAWITYSTTVTVSKAGISMVEARTIDNVGNISAISSKNVFKDITPPVVTANPTSSDWVDDMVTVALTYTDADSGIAVQQYAWSLSSATPASGAWINYTIPISQSAQGIWYLHYKAVDNVGHETIGNFGVYKVKRETGLKVSNVRVTPRTVVLKEGQTSALRKMTATFTISNLLFPNHGKPINPVVTIKYGSDTVNTTLWVETVQMPANGSTTKTVNLNNVILSPGKKIIVEVNGIETGYLRFDEYHYSGMDPYVDNKESVTIFVSKPTADVCKIFLNDTNVRNYNSWSEEWTKTKQEAVVVPPYFNVTSRTTTTEVMNYNESYKITSLKFRSKYTIDNQQILMADPLFTGQISLDGWQTIRGIDALSTSKQREDNIAKIKAGYGFEVVVETKYITNRYLVPVGYVESFSDMVYSAVYGNGYANYTVVSPSVTPVESPSILYFNMYDSAGINRYCQEIPIVNSQGSWYNRTSTFERSEAVNGRIWTEFHTLPEIYDVNIKTPYGSNIQDKFMGYEQETPVGDLSNKGFLYDTFNFKLQILGQDDIKSHFGN